MDRRSSMAVTRTFVRERRLAETTMLPYSIKDTPYSIHCSFVLYSPFRSYTIQREETEVAQDWMSCSCQLFLLYVRSTFFDMRVHLEFSTVMFLGGAVSEREAIR